MQIYRKSDLPLSWPYDSEKEKTEMRTIKHLTQHSITTSKYFYDVMQQTVTVSSELSTKSVIILHGIVRNALLFAYIFGLRSVHLKLFNGCIVPLFPFFG